MIGIETFQDFNGKEVDLFSCTNTYNKTDTSPKTQDDSSENTCVQKPIFKIEKIDKSKIVFQVNDQDDSPSVKNSQTPLLSVDSKTTKEKETIRCDKPRQELMSDITARLWPKIELKLKGWIDSTKVSSSFIRKVTKFIKESFSFNTLGSIKQIGIVKTYLQRIAELDCLKSDCTHHVEEYCTVHKKKDICNSHHIIERCELTNKRKKLDKLNDDGEVVFTNNYCSHKSFGTHRDRVLLNQLCNILREITDEECGIKPEDYIHPILRALNTSCKETKDPQSKYTHFNLNILEIAFINKSPNDSLNKPDANPSFLKRKTKLQRPIINDFKSTCSTTILTESNAIYSGYTAQLENRSYFSTGDSSDSRESTLTTNFNEHIYSEFEFEPNHSPLLSNTDIYGLESLVENPLHSRYQTYCSPFDSNFFNRRDSYDDFLNIHSPQN